MPHARAPQAPERTSASPFESLLDTAPARDNSPPPASDDASRADRPEPVKSAQQADQASKPANSVEKPKSDAKADDTADVSDAKPADGDAKPAKNTTTDTDTKTTKDAKEAAKAAADGKASELAGLNTGIDPTKPAGDAKPVDAVTVEAVAVQPAPVAATAPADALAVGLVPDAATQADAKPAAAGDATIVAAAASNLEKAAAPKADAGKTGDESKPSTDTTANTATKSADATASKPHIEAKPQTTSDEDNKTASAHARGENSAKDDRMAATHAGATPNAEPNAAAPKAGNDAFQPLLTTQQHTITAPTNLAAPQLAAHTAAVPLAGIAIEITSKALAGTNHFEIRLDPPELGRIEVRMDVDRDGNVTSRLIVDRADTLDLLRRDASGLERALQDAGLKTADNGLQFSLRDQSANQQQTADGSDTAHLVVNDEMLSADAMPRIYSRLAGQGSGIDIHV